MKPGIHPTWYPEAVVTCACGNTWTTGSTKKEIHTDVCSNCHPFFTGEQRIVDTAGQVERFMKRISAKEQIAAAQPAPEEKKSKKEKRRERKIGAVVEPPVQQPPAELPLAVAHAPSAPVAEMSETPAASEPEGVEPAQSAVEGASAEISGAVSNAELPEGEDQGVKSKAPRKSGTRRTSPAQPKASEPNEPKE